MKNSNILTYWIFDYDELKVETIKTKTNRTEIFHFTCNDSKTYITKEGEDDKNTRCMYNRGLRKT